ncbi:MAG: putative ATPase/class 3 adenylate cyclase [Lysobacterales bacterium]|jgi:predicted ATPase/class 3 adenylate cyclase
MHKQVQKIAGFLREVWRRKVIRTAGAYLVAAWVLIQVSSEILSAFTTPPIVMQVILVLLGLGLPIVMILSWVYEITAKGVVRSEELDAVVEEEVIQPKSVRRRMTMLSASIIIQPDGGHLDPEDVIEIQPRAMELCRQVCERFDGHLVPARGGEILAYFGYPTAHEDDSKNAVRAALGLVAGMKRLDVDTDNEVTLQIGARVAVHTGEVISEELPEIGDKKASIVGVLPGQVAALMDLCALDEVRITSDVHQLVRGYFETEAIEEPVLGAGHSNTKTYLVLNESGARNRLEAMEEGELMPMVGRAHEMGMLKQNWQRSKEGHGHVAIVLSGGPGIGKSRIIHAIKEMVAEEHDAWLIELFCQPMMENTALSPVTNYFRDEVLCLNELESDKERLDAIEGLLAEHNEDLEEAVPLLAQLLDVPLSNEYSPPGFSAPLARKATLELLVTLLTERSDSQPVLLIFEDLHWSDPTTGELLAMLIEEIPSHQMMCVMTVRPPFESPWPFSSNVNQLNLAGLEAEAATAVCNALSATLPQPVIAQITAKADGVPLFIEEVTKTVIESGAFDKELSESAMNDLIDKVLPATLQDALTARLDHLGQARNVAQLGATIGRDFSHELISRVADQINLKKLDESLLKLVDSEILFKRGSGQKTAYRFKHAMIQDAAYHQLIKKERQHYHRNIAELLSEDFPQLYKKQPELLAIHHTRAGQGEQAIPHWLAAGVRANRSSADVEAMSHFQHGLDLLDEVKSKSERTQLELELQSAMGPSLMAVRGYSAAEVEVAYQRAHELCDQVGETPRLIPVLGGLWAYNQVRANLDEALAYATRLLKIGKSTKNDDLLLEAHVFLGVSNLHLGCFKESIEHMRAAIKRYDEGKHASHAYIYGQNPGMAAHAYLADALWLTGKPAEAFREAQTAIKHARKIKHPHSLAFALAISARMCVRHKDAKQAKLWAGESLKLSTHYGFPVWANMSRILLAWSDSQLEGAEAGVTGLKDTLAKYTASGSYNSTAWYKGLLAEMYGNLDKIDEAMMLIDEALEESDQKDHHAGPELLRIKASLLLQRNQQGDHQLAEETCQLAISKAQSSVANGWLVGASLLLAELNVQNDNIENARKILETGLAPFSDEDQGLVLNKARDLLRQYTA